MSGSSRSTLSRFRDPVSAHWRSSRNKTSARVFSAIAPMKFRNVRLKRFRVSIEPSAGTGGCSPMMSSISGITSAMTRPFGETAARILALQSASSFLVSVRICRTISRSAASTAAYGTLRVNWSNLPAAK